MKDIADEIQRRRDKGEGPVVGPYKTEKENPDGTTYTVTTEVWELAVVESVFKFPKRRTTKKQKASEAKLTDEARADLAKLGRFRRAKARGLGEYLTMQRYALEVMLVEGLVPTITPDPKASDFVRGTAHIRCKVVTSTTGSRTEYYLFVKIHPSSAAPTHRLAVFSEDPDVLNSVGLGDEAQAKHDEVMKRREEEIARCTVLYGTDSADMMVGLILQKK